MDKLKVIYTVANLPSKRYYNMAGNMAYEVFKRSGARVESPTLSIVPEGRIAINAAAARIFVSLGIKSVLLLWDRASHKLAIKAAHKGDKNAYAVSIAPASHSGSLRAKSFLRYIGWHAPMREMISATWNEKEKMLEATLPPEHLTEKAPTSKLKSAGV
jgi:hypothetical protein